MGLKIYREINNNTVDNRDKNILLQFVCEVNLYNYTEIFCDCLQYLEDIGDYAEVSRAYYSLLKHCVNYLQRCVERTGQTDINGPWIDEANRCIDILNKELQNGEHFYIMFAD